MDEQILKTFRALAPEFAAVPDDDVKLMIDIARPYVSQKRFADLYFQAVAYYTAHLLAWNKMIADYGNDNQALTAGTVINAKEGDLQMGYTAVKLSGEVEDLNKTAYGVRFLNLGRRRVTAGIVRGGERDG